MWSFLLTFTVVHVSKYFHLRVWLDGKSLFDIVLLKVSPFQAPLRLVLLK